MRSRRGFTLLEVVVAGGLLALGASGLLTLQAKALQVQRRVAVVRRLVAAAEAELSRSLALQEPVTGPCSSAESAGLSSCRVEVASCAGSSAGHCALPGSAGATRVGVTVTSGGQRFELSALHAPFGDG